MFPFWLTPIAFSNYYDLSQIILLDRFIPTLGWIHWSKCFEGKTDGLRERECCNLWAATGKGVAPGQAEQSIYILIGRSFAFGGGLTFWSESLRCWRKSSRSFLFLNSFTTHNAWVHNCGVKYKVHQVRTNAPVPLYFITKFLLSGYGQGIPKRDAVKDMLIL